MSYIITNKMVRKSGLCLANRIRELGGPELGVSTKPIPDNQVSIRWGTSQMIYGKETGFNSPQVIRMVANKYLLSIELLRNGFPHVVINSEIPEHFPVVVRKELSKSGGKGIVICRNEAEFTPLREFMWSYWVNFRYELGVHILGGEIVKIFKKLWIGTEPEPEFPIKNSDRNYSFSICKLESFKRLPEIVRNLISIVPIQFGRIDIGWDEEEGQYKVIEINSAPGLSENDSTLNLYAEFLMKRI